MRIYIDEAGGFVVPSPTKQHSYSLVLALVVPTTIEPELFYGFRPLRDGWPNPQVEIKGSKLNESQAAELIALLGRYDVLVNFFTIDMAAHGNSLTDDFKARQADAITAHLTPEHRESLIAELRADADKMRSMPNQLFLQAFLMISLVLEAIQEA